jgi:hypothetical protein
MTAFHPVLTIFRMSSVSRQSKREMERHLMCGRRREMLDEEDGDEDKADKQGGDRVRDRGELETADKKNCLSSPLFSSPLLSSSPQCFHPNLQ